MTAPLGMPLVWWLVVLASIAASLTGHRALGTILLAGAVLALVLKAVGTALWLHRRRWVVAEVWRYPADGAQKWARDGVPRSRRVMTCRTRRGAQRLAARRTAAERRWESSQAEQGKPVSAWLQRDHVVLGRTPRSEEES